MRYAGQNHELEVPLAPGSLDAAGFARALAGFHALNESMFELARGYARSGMSAYVELQEREFALEESGYTATRHQREVGAGYFDGVLDAVTGGEASTRALEGSTEEAQFTTV